MNMLPIEKEKIINQSKKWITNVVVGCNFCPFASREVKRDTIHYEVLEAADIETVLQSVAATFLLLDNEDAIETALLILPNGFETFTDYLELVDIAEGLLEKEDYEGIYQIASFHPDYLFAGSTKSDPSNYTNRSPYPMLHFLREDRVSEAIDSHPDIDSVPDANIAFTQEKGLRYMQQLLSDCMKDSDPEKA